MSPNVNPLNTKIGLTFFVTIFLAIIALSNLELTVSQHALELQFEAVDFAETTHIELSDPWPLALFGLILQKYDT